MADVKLSAMDLYTGSEDPLAIDLYTIQSGVQKRIHPSQLGLAVPATTQTVNFNSSMTASQIQALIDAIPTFIPSGNIVTLQFADGTYSSLAGTIATIGFYGGGKLYILGNSGDSGLNTSKSVHLDFTGDACDGLDISECYVTVEARYFKITCDDGHKCIDYQNVIGEGKVADNYLVNIAKTSSNSRGISIGSSSIFLQNNYFSNNKYAINATSNSKVYSFNNDDTGTLPDIGLRSTSNTSIGKNGTQPSGSSSNEEALFGGVIR